MVNAVRADLYRLFHTKGFYITQFLLILFVVISVSAEATGNVGVNTLEEPTDMQSHLQVHDWDSYQTFIAFSSMASFLIYFCLPLLVMIAGYDFVHKSYKNQLTSGVSRLQYFGSKYLIFIVVTALQFLFYYTFAFLTAAVKNGIGTAPKDFWMNALQTIGIQFIAFQAIFIIGLCILVITFSNVSSVIIIIVIPLIINVLSAFFNIGWLKYFDFQYGINFAWIRDLPDFSWLTFLGFSLGVIIVMNYIAYQAFRHKSL
ncbi:ABC-2 transporter permease [Oceanobacillus sp. FSL W8-0428]|uniref:Lantibiotic ABC transporter permease n=1 Tax=Oceanobacillus sojae TaxID=582851 RepID=A0A511ZQQ7_9BACI|nr:ABC-2 transporter permease [Oceanobacillus sojae]GEN89719.1 lantibiotic ABC transporter permease [Oceanobacillus sojae]